MLNKYFLNDPVLPEKDVKLHFPAVLRLLGKRKSSEEESVEVVTTSNDIWPQGGLALSPNPCGPSSSGHELAKLSIHVAHLQGLDLPPCRDSS